MGRQVVLYHVLEESIDINEFESRAYATAQGDNIVVELEAEGGLLLDGLAYVFDGNMHAVNGVVHIIDRVVFPPSLE